MAGKETGNQCLEGSLAGRSDIMFGSLHMGRVRLYGDLSRQKPRTDFLFSLVIFRTLLLLF